jgi:outer membrane protein OmpA-like peptidoglycan-associated protein
MGLAGADSDRASFVDHWIVTFDSGSSLDARGQATLRAAVEEIRAARVANMVVQGHADSAGAPGLDRTLAQRRADAIRRALLAEGIRADIAMRSPSENGQQRPSGATTILLVRSPAG